MLYRLSELSSLIYGRSWHAVRWPALCFWVSSHKKWFSRPHIRFRWIFRPLWWFMGPLGMIGWPGEGWVSELSLEGSYLRNTATKNVHIADCYPLRCYQAGRISLVIFAMVNNSPDGLFPPLEDPATADFLGTHKSKKQCSRPHICFRWMFRPFWRFIVLLGMTGWPGEGWASEPPLEGPYLRNVPPPKMLDRLVCTRCYICMNDVRLYIVSMNEETVWYGVILCRMRGNACSTTSRIRQ